MSETARLRKEAARDYRRIAELEAKATADRKYMDKAEARIAELEELVVRVEQQRNTMTAERDELESLLVESRECQRKVSP